MSLTINVPEPLATQLQSRAQAEKVPVDELASRLLESGMRVPLDAEQWRAKNARRIALIEQRFTHGLTDVEEDELQQLQHVADQQLEHSDRAMLRDVSQMEIRSQVVLRGSP